MICDLLFTRLSAVRKVPEILVFLELGIFETLGSKISHGASKKIADVRTHLRKVSKKSIFQKNILQKRAEALFYYPIKQKVNFPLDKSLP